MLISIHALLAESDQTAYSFLAGGTYFYPRSPCGERPRGEHHASTQQEFLSTLSLRRATNDAINGCNPDYISIHALLAECDRRGGFCYLDNIISIHALLAESDYLGAGKSCNVCDFYPRSPCGERPSIAGRITLNGTFLSTLSLRRATVGQKRLRQKLAISIHALLAESDA